ncbi:MAG: exo-alpha-sialidase [Opitutaceae bacterium]|nr:exo-alpha-sialidase [Opitutaceae bacterium]
MFAALGAALAGLLLASAAAAAGEPEVMAEVQLDGLRLRFGQPVQVAAQLAWEEGPNRRWVMNHPVASAARFPNGDLLISYSLVSDYYDNPRNLSGLQFSRDHGRTWSRRYDFVAEHQAMVYTPGPEGSLLGIPAYLYPVTPGEEHNFEATYTRIERAGARVVLEPQAVKVRDWPWPVAGKIGWGFYGADPVPGLTPSNRYVPLVFDGNALEVGGRLLATGYGMRKGDSQYRNVIFASEDGGLTWRHFSTVADATGLPGEAEGPNEIAMIQLADGDLMTVFRVGSGREWKLRRAYSHDQGRTWTKPDVLPAYSVEPSLLRAANGTLVLSSGRPGIGLWLSTDPRGERWQEVDIVQLHDRWAPDRTYRIGPDAGPAPAAGQPDRRHWHSSSYTEVIEVSPNRLILVYDRSPKPQPANHADLTRIFALPIEIVRE